MLFLVPKILEAMHCFHSTHFLQIIGRLNLKPLKGSMIGILIQIYPNQKTLKGRVCVRSHREDSITKHLPHFKGQTGAGVRRLQGFQDLRWQGRRGFRWIQQSWL